MDNATKSLIEATLARRAKAGLNMQIAESGFQRSFPTAEARDAWVKRVEANGRTAKPATDWKTV